MKRLKLTLEATLILLELKYRGEESVNFLVESLSFDQDRLMHITKSLRNRGLIYIGYDEQRDLIVGLSRKGQKALA